MDTDITTLAAAVSELQAEMRRLTDKDAIADVLYRYTVALDTHRWSDLEDVFTPDATMVVASADVGDRIAINDEVAEGRDGVIGTIRSILDGMDATQHVCAQPLIEVNGDGATSTSYLHEQHYFIDDHGPETLETGGIYIDKLIRTPDGWRITERVLQNLYWNGDVTLIDRAMQRVRARES
jgi:hypothetical protein